MLKWAAVVLLILLAIPVLAVAAVLILANVNPGRRFIQNETASLTGGMVRIEGLAGRFPDALRVGRIEVSDARGPYVTVTNATLDWSPSDLLNRTVLIDQLQAETVDVARLPVSSGQSSSSGTFNLPVQVDLRQLHVGKAIIGAPVAGTAATLALDGSATLQTLTEGSVQLDVHRLDSPGHYTVTGRIAPDAIQATVTAQEPTRGLIASIAHLPDLGAVSIQASINGPKDALGTQVGVTAGPLTASVSGTVDLTHQVADLAVKANAPAMTPAAGVSWQSVLVDATVHGPFTRPDAKGTVQIASLSAGGVQIGALAADVNGNAGQVQLHATVSNLDIPGPKPSLFAANPVTLDASVRLDAPDRPVTFAVHHPLLSLDGTAKTAGVQRVQAHLVLPDVSPFAEAGGADVHGSTDIMIQAEMQNGTTTTSAKGKVAITGGMAPVPALIGDGGTIDVAASMHGQDISLSHLTLNGKSLTVTAQGGLSDQTVNADWTVALADLTAIQPNLSGRLDVKGHAGGTLNDLAVQAELGADLAAKGYSSGHITAKVDATGLPGAPHATVNADGKLLDAPLSLALTADEAAGAFKVSIDQASWKSLKAGGTASLTPPATLPIGNLHVDLGRLADLEPLLGRKITGQANATLESDDRAAKLALTVRDAALPGTAAIAKAVLNATVTDPTGHPAVDATFAADGVSAGTTQSATARVTAKGPIDALGITIDANAPAVAGAAAKLTTAATLNVQARTVALAKLEATWKQQTLRLLAPAKLTFADGVSVDRLRLGFQQAELTLSGSAGSKLDLTASLRNLPANIGSIVNPAFAADGMIAADARLNGTTAHPQGTIKLTATGLRQRQGPGQALPAANLTANAVLQGTSAQLDTKLTAGPSHLSVTGSVPLSQTGALNLKTDGHVDLAMLDPLLTAEGRRARGEVDLNASVTGTAASPLASGTAQLSKGDLADYTIGAHVSDLSASIQATGDTIRLTQFSGKAGPGTLGGSGSISLAGDMPVDLHFTANNARALASDLMSAMIDANLTVQGDIKGNLQAGGTLHVRRADIRIPDKLPPGVAVLPVRNASAPPPPPPPPATQSSIALNLTISAPQQVFIRGRGLNAELGGTIHIHGTATQPIPDGGLHLRQGTLSVIGTTLNFTEGTIDFSGAGIANPSIHFVATSTTASIVATLTVSGYASDPKITLSSVPDMPQDEILSQLLFNTSTSKLSALQLAQIAAALASLSGATAGFDPLESLRTGLGLDRLSIGSSSTGAPTLQAGRYVARGVYVGAQQSASGGGTQATVQIDLAKGLKLETTAGSGSTSATGAASSGDAASIGITYQFEY
ncbi:translocation/assembly module TamB domain-containing protein [Acidisphaera sp. S103]|uniref:translocation/assembly module TamB domain-containing protein n=1 Tax=Acidisphaera sp. S103 TaxID=1747223 RepID=UPI0020B124B3|nr:translocation/assembly module TamB domain-containing protein [Acidisphaera sp. S103]